MGSDEKFNKKAFLEGKCPNCGSGCIVDVTGWCGTHASPRLNGGDFPFCSMDSEGDAHSGLVSIIAHAYICDDCDMLFDEHKMIDWSKKEFSSCPVGQKVIEASKDRIRKAGK